MTRVGSTGAPLQRAVLHEQFQSISEDVGGHAALGADVVEASRAEKERRQDLLRPAIAKMVDGLAGQQVQLRALVRRGGNAPVDLGEGMRSSPAPGPSS